MAAREPPHWMAVDRCFPHTERAAAMAYTRARLTELEGRVVHRVEVEAALVRCPQDHGWARVQPVIAAVETPAGGYWAHAS